LDSEVRMMIIREFIGLWRFTAPLAGLGGAALTGALLNHHHGVIVAVGNGGAAFAFAMLIVTIGGLLGLGICTILNLLWK
jgi:hypothetical protein